MDKFIAGGWRLLARFMFFVPVPIFVLGAGPNLYDSGPLGWVVFVVLTMAITLLCLSAMKATFKKAPRKKRNAEKV